MIQLDVRLKTLHLTIIVILICSTLLYLKPIQAYAANDVEIQNIQTLPPTIIVGQTFKINATLINNSSNPIFVEHGACQAPFSATFDNHVLVSTNNINCTTQMIEQKLNPGEKIIATSPYLDLVYNATEAGTTNATVTFSYSIWDPTNQSNIEKTISKSFLFTICCNNSGVKTVNETPLSPLEQFKSGFTVTEVTCATNYVLTIKSEDGSPACVKPSTVRILTERGWAKFESVQINHTSNAKTNPFGIAGLIIYYGGGPCGVGICPLNTFNLKITSNYTAYLLGYNICDGNICAKNDNMEILLPISNVSFPNFKTIALPEDLNWKYKDTIHIQVMASAFPENETATSVDLGNSTTFP